MKLKQKILNEMVETEEDKIVRELRKEPSFNENFIRRRYKELTSHNDTKKSLLDN